MTRRRHLRHITREQTFRCTCICTKVWIRFIGALFWSKKRVRGDRRRVEMYPYLVVITGYGLYHFARGFQKRKCARCTQADVLCHGYRKITLLYPFKLTLGLITLVSLQSRINLSPFTKDFRAVEQSMSL